MMSFHVSVTGGQVGRAIAREIEEIPYMLAELTEALDEGDIAELGELLSERTDPTERKRIAAFAQVLLGACS